MTDKPQKTGTLSDVLKGFREEDRRNFLDNHMYYPDNSTFQPLPIPSRPITVPGRPILDYTNPQVNRALAAYESAADPKAKWKAQDRLCRLADRESDGLGMVLHIGNNVYIAGCEHYGEFRTPLLIMQNKESLYGPPSTFVSAFTAKTRDFCKKRDGQ